MNARQACPNLADMVGRDLEVPLEVTKCDWVSHLLAARSRSGENRSEPAQASATTTQHRA